MQKRGRARHDAGVSADRLKAGTHTSPESPPHRLSASSSPVKHPYESVRDTPGRGHRGGRRRRVDLGLRSSYVIWSWGASPLWPILECLALLTSGCGWHYLQSAASPWHRYRRQLRAQRPLGVPSAGGQESPPRDSLLFVLIGLAGLGINHLLLWQLTDGPAHSLPPIQTRHDGGGAGLEFRARKILLFTSPNSVAP